MFSPVGLSLLVGDVNHYIHDTAFFFRACNTAGIHLLETGECLEVTQIVCRACSVSCAGWLLVRERYTSFGLLQVYGPEYLALLRDKLHIACGVLVGRLFTEVLFERL